jgi:hypothetical protein
VDVSVWRRSAIARCRINAREGWLGIRIRSITVRTPLEPVACTPCGNAPEAALNMDRYLTCTRHFLRFRAGQPALGVLTAAV